MKASELRIGNFVFDTFILGKCELTKFGIDDFNVINNYVESNHAHPYKGIPLTEEWLLKFGFEQKKGLLCWVKEDVEIIYETLASFYRLYPRTNSIKHVHQLQNLYFALTGEELTIKN